MKSKQAHWKEVLKWQKAAPTCQTCIHAMLGEGYHSAYRCKLGGFATKARSVCMSHSPAELDERITQEPM